MKARKHRAVAVGVCAILALTFAACAVEAQGSRPVGRLTNEVLGQPPEWKLRLGPFELDPYLNYDVSYDSNIEMADKGQHRVHGKGDTQDVVHRLSIGVDSRTRFGQGGAHRLTFRTGGVARIYSNHNDLTTTDPDLGVDLLMNFMGGRLKVNVTDTYQGLASVYDDPVRIPVVPKSGDKIVRPADPGPDGGRFWVTRRTNFRRDINTFRIRTSYDFGLTDLALTYMWRRYDYRSGEFAQLDRDENSINLENALKLFHDRIGERLDWLLGYTYTHVNRDSTTQPDSIGHQAYTGVRYDLTEKLKAEGRIGWEMVDFHSKGRSAAPYSSGFLAGRTISSDDDDYNGLIYSVSLEHQLTRKISHKFEFSRSVEQGYVSNFFIRNRYAYEINWSATQKLGLGVYGALDHARESGEDYVLAAPPAGWGVGQANEDMKFYTLGIRSTYALTKWANFNLGYEFQTRRSNQSGNDFDRHLVTAGLSIRL